MRICDDGHDEVCYNAPDCPVCDKMKEIAQLSDEVNSLKQIIDEARSE